VCVLAEQTPCLTIIKDAPAALHAVVEKAGGAQEGDDENLMPKLFTHNTYTTSVCIGLYL
jgi:hypothetical protein